MLGIIGPNGAGKTSLFEVLSGRLRPKAGTVTFKGHDVTRLPLYERARLGIGRTYQTPVVPDELTVGEAFKAARQAYRPYLTSSTPNMAPSLPASMSTMRRRPRASTRSTAASFCSPVC